MKPPAETLDCDVLVIGGGVNGAGIARDAAGRGLSVVLCEKDDLGAHTSSASSKLIHGGLRYLEHYEFSLVRKSLIEREVLLRAAPHIMWPLRIVMPYDRGGRPAWLLRLGFFLYDHLARRELLPGSHGIDLRAHVAGAPLKPRFARGFVYSDAAVDDARLVVLNAVAAFDHGAAILTHTRCVGAERHARHWQCSLQEADGRVIKVKARCLVNAGGAWAAQLLHTAVGQPSVKTLRLVKGSHIVVRKLFDHDYAYIFQHPDGRIVFAIPYQGDFTLIGTTDVEYHGDPGKVAIDQAEIDYLCALSSRYFNQPIIAADVVWSYSGVRPLVDEAAGAGAPPASVTRDYRLDFDTAGAPLLSVFGGKITTARKLAEEAVDLIAPAIGHRGGGRWTAGACLPGGDLFGAGPTNGAVLGFDAYVLDLQRQLPWLAPALVARYARAYGSRIQLLLDGCTNMEEMGEEIAPGLYAKEVRYLMRHEWARCAEDVLWRRSKLGLHLPAGSAARLDRWMAEGLAGRPSAMMENSR
jgi:glycerol-3-phosphate dehydrogenase